MFQRIFRWYSNFARRSCTGDSVFPYLDLDDEIIELSITPNRADALSMRGVAYEVAAIYDKSVHFKDFPLLETQEQAGEQLSVAIETDKAPFMQHVFWKM